MYIASDELQAVTIDTGAGDDVHCAKSGTKFSLQMCHSPIPHPTAPPVHSHTETTMITGLIFLQKKIGPRFTWMMPHPANRAQARVRLLEPLARLVVLTPRLDASVVVAEVGPAVLGLVHVRKTCVELCRLHLHL